MSPNKVNETVTASHIRMASAGLRHSAAQTSGKYFTQPRALSGSPLLSFPRYRYRPINLSSAARPGESFSKGMLLSGTWAVRLRLWNSVESDSLM